jgi:hypothetical protein
MTCCVKKFAHRIILFVLFGVALCACGSSTKIEGEILDAQASPGGRAVATLSRTTHGATVADVYRVYIGTADSEAITELVRADKVEGLYIEWRDATTLVVHMKCGKVFRFTNFFYVRTASDKLTLISVLLHTAGPCPV